ncbi:aryl-sulfate sulfotransferase [Shewanella sp. A32]|uniref:aryl-sulfate sulfotransferase n=1 Tax=Shewanella sp. A32 TaxID=3031327 RepID=UPI0023B8A881|nr:aryl-sulfate sulfotransferase [Shewanella sp. A32]MDF0533411.1 aryl-sulfate sulfotransferase [Shewanella sp. A32]
MRRSIFSVLMLSLTITAVPGIVPQASASVLNISRPSQGQLGLVTINPYGYAPLTAIIGLAGHMPTDVRVTVKGKGKEGVDISYNVGHTQLLTYDGVPVFGLYANYQNQVELRYTLDGKQVDETYRIFTQPLLGVSVDNAVSAYPTVKPVTVAKGFKQRLYWINHLIADQHSESIRWANGGALEWDRWPIEFITDTQGEVRWYLDPYKIHDQNDIAKRGILMGVHQLANGDVVFLQGQRYYRMDLMGRMVFQRWLPRGYIDMSHDMKALPNGHFLLRAAKKDYHRPDGKVVDTVRDQILEVDADGRLVDVWDLNQILDPLRDALMSALDPRAVCLSVDLKAKDAKLEPDAPFGDHMGVGTGRNWAHVNSVEYDPHDDAIIISLRHQGVFKIGRDKQVKWILAPRKGWNEKLASKLLTPVDAKGHQLDCDENGLCDNSNFDFGYAQHAAYLVPQKGTLTLFDNGDGRHLEQPLFANQKYSRAVEYKIDEQKLTVQQKWEFGKDKGYDWYSPVTSIIRYQPDTDTMMVFFATGKLLEQELTEPKLVEVKYGSQQVEVELDMTATTSQQASYRALVIHPELAFGR